MSERKRTPIGEFILRRRKALDMSQEQLVERLAQYGEQFSHTSVSHWESKKDDQVLPPIKNESFRNALAKALDTTPYVILREAGFLEGIDAPISDDVLDWAVLIEQLPPEQREAVRQILESFRRDQKL